MSIRSDSSLSPNRHPAPHPTRCEADGCAVCGCRCRGGGATPHWAHRTPVKRKQLDFAEEPPPEKTSSELLQVLHLAAPSGDVMAMARVQAEHELVALQEAVASQGKLIEDLYGHLEEERSASSSSASEAMSMILRLQREKAEVQMEARQFKQFAEEKMAHDQQEIAALEDVCFGREQTIQSLLCQIQAYRHRMLSLGVDPDAAHPADASASTWEPRGGGDDLGTLESSVSVYNYPSLTCRAPNVDDIYDDLVVKYAAGDTPRTPGSSALEHLHHIEQRIREMERNSAGTHLGVLEKEVVVGNSPRPSRLERRASCDSCSSFVTREVVRERTTDYNHRHDDPPVVCDHHLLDVDDDKMSDRVYGLDATDIVAAPAPVRLHEDYPSSPGSGIRRGEATSERTDIKKLYMRLQALEVDRENLKQAIISMRTDQAQMVLLKELAENLSKGVVVPPPAPTPTRALRKKPSLLGTFSFFSALKWIVSFQWMVSLAFWKKKTKHCKYMLRLTNGKVGLLVVLDKTLLMRQWRCLTRPIN